MDPPATAIKPRDVSITQAPLSGEAAAFAGLGGGRRRPPADHAGLNRS
jgi:hypothetical protein